MTMEERVTRAMALETLIREATPMKRLEMLPEFSRVLSGIRKEGGAVPGHLRGLEQMLSEELAESRFDNMPV